MEDKKPESLDELCDYIVKYVDDIYVKEQINEKWGSYSLSEIPSRLAIKHVLKWVKEGIIPYRVIDMKKKS